MRWILALLLLFPGAAVPQKKAAKKPSPPKAAPARDRWPIESLTVEGNKHYSSDQILAAAGLRVGQMAGEAEFEAARNRLIATGLFETVGYRFAPAAGGKGFAGSFQDTEVEPFYPVRFDRLDTPAADLARWLKSRDPLFGERIPPTAAVLERHARAIEEFLAAKGRKEKVIGKLVADAPNQFSIVFRPQAPEPAVAEVRFEGNSVIPTTQLTGHFAGIAYGTLYREPAFRQLLDAGVRPLYEARGRIQVAFPKLRVEKAENVDGVVVTVTVEEGPSFDLGEVTLAGESPVPPEALLEAGNFRLKELANFDEINAGTERMKKRLRREGYMHADLQVERKINAEKNLVDLVVRPDPGAQYLFGRLKVEGLDLHGEAAIKKLWTMKEGKPYNGDYPDYFLQRVRDGGLFDDLGTTKAISEVNEEAHTVDVTLRFGPAPTEPGAGPPATKGRRKR